MFRRLFSLILLAHILTACRQRTPPIATPAAPQPTATRLIQPTAPPATQIPVEPTRPAATATPVPPTGTLAPAMTPMQVVCSTAYADSNALWSVDADSGKVGLVLARQSVGTFSVSPDGKFIALALPQSIELLDAGATSKQHLLDFPFIKTYSEYAYFPPLEWGADSSFFNAVVPSEDPLAADASVTFYRMGVDGKVQKLGTYPGNFVMGGPIFPSFSPDGGGHVVSLSGDKQTFVATGDVIALRWYDADSFLFFRKPSDKYGLYFERLREATRPLVVGLSQGTSFDSRLPSDATE